MQYLHLQQNLPIDSSVKRDIPIETVNLPQTSATTAKILNKPAETEN